MRVTNTTKTLLHVPIILANGTKDTINLMPQRRADLPEGAVLDPGKAPLLGKALKIHEPQSTAPSTPPAQTPPPVPAPVAPAPVPVPAAPAPAPAVNVTVGRTPA